MYKIFLSICLFLFSSLSLATDLPRFSVTLNGDEHIVIVDKDNQSLLPTYITQFNDHNLKSSIVINYYPYTQEYKLFYSSCYVPVKIKEITVDLKNSCFTSIEKFKFSNLNKQKIPLENPDQNLVIEVLSL